MQETELVRIKTTSKQLDPNVYKVVKFSGLVAHIRIVGDGSDKILKVNKKRIVKDMSTQTIEANTTATTTRTPKKTAPLYDFDAKLAEMGDGAIRFCKPMPKFANATAVSHVIVNGARTQFFAINTYNGSAGKQGKADGKYYEIKKDGWHKKLARMTKDGYIEA